MLCKFLLAGILAAAPQPAAAQQRVEQAESLSRSEKIIRGAVQAVQTMKRDPRLARVLRDSKGVFIVPHLFAGASVAGGPGDDAVLLSHRADGSWSSPAFFTLASIGIGARSDGAYQPAAMILMTEDALESVIGNTGLTPGSGGGLNVTGYGVPTAPDPRKPDVVVWSPKDTAFVAATLSAPGITFDEQKNRAWYGRLITPQEIVGGEVRPARDTALQEALSG